jgi:hypothetical protein
MIAAKNAADRPQNEVIFMMAPFLAARPGNSLPASGTIGNACLSRV